jgi:nicotinamidase-related amidase
MAHLVCLSCLEPSLVFWYDTQRLAADLDYHVIVVEDGCADRDPEVHQRLMEKMFPRQATVVSAAALVA